MRRDPDCERFSAYVDAERLAGRYGAAALDDRCRRMLRGVPFAGGDALDVGAGDGLLSLWLLHHGARRVVSLEPEAAGASRGVGERAVEHGRRLGIPAERWDYRAETFQAFAPDRPFRLILSHASINHLDEPACARAHADPAARAAYRAIFGKMRALLEPGGSLVVVDVGRINYWDRLGLACPWAPGNEWDKHQEPATWCALLAEAGLAPVAVRWPVPIWRLRRLGPLVGNRWVARCLGSIFAITARAPIDQAAAASARARMARIAAP